MHTSNGVIMTSHISTMNTAPQIQSSISEYNKCTEQPNSLQLSRTTLHGAVFGFLCTQHKVRDMWTRKLKFHSSVYTRV